MSPTSFGPAPESPDNGFEIRHDGPKDQQWVETPAPSITGPEFWFHGVITPDKHGKAKALGLPGIEVDAWYTEQNGFEIRHDGPKTQQWDKNGQLNLTSFLNEFMVGHWENMWFDPRPRGKAKLEMYKALNSTLSDSNFEGTLFCELTGNVISTLLEHSPIKNWNFEFLYNPYDTPKGYELSIKNLITMGVTNFELQYISDCKQYEAFPQSKVFVASFGKGWGAWEWDQIERFMDECKITPYMILTKTLKQKDLIQKFNEFSFKQEGLKLD